MKRLAVTAALLRPILLGFLIGQLDRYSATLGHVL
jgi:hypothetical protein